MSTRELARPGIRRFACKSAAPHPGYTFALLFISLLLGCKANYSQSARSAMSRVPATIFIIRHAEKLTNGQRDLSAAGKERALLLTQAFSSNGYRPDLLTPQVLIAAHASVHSNRSLQTLLTLAASLHLPVNDQFKDDDYEELATALLSGAYAGKVVLVAWHRGKIPQLAAALETTPPYARWPEQQFDRIWRIDYVDGKAHLGIFPMR